MIPIVVVIYFVIGIGFGALTEDSQPDVIQNSKILRGIVLLGFMFLWLPYVIINACFVNRDIWFRRKTE